MKKALRRFAENFVTRKTRANWREDDLRRQLLQGFARSVGKPHKLEINDLLVDQTRDLLRVIKECERDRKLPENSNYGFTLSLGRSDSLQALEGDGKGVFVEGVAKKGQVLGFVDGLVFKNFNLWFEEYGDENSDDFVQDDELRQRTHDQVIVDGRFNVADEVKKRGEFGLGSSSFTPYVVTQCKMPPFPVPPNVLACDLSLVKEQVEEDFWPYIPNAWAEDMMLAGDVLIKTIVYIARRTIRDEELYYPFRFNPKKDYPEWYWISDLEDAKIRFGYDPAVFDLHDQRAVFKAEHKYRPLGWASNEGLNPRPPLVMKGRPGLASKLPEPPPPDRS